MQCIKRWFDVCVQKTTFKTKLRLAEQIAIASSEKKELEERIRYIQDQIEGKEKILETMSVNSGPAHCLVHQNNDQHFDVGFTIADSKQFDFEDEMEPGSQDVAVEE